ncbi:type VI secretion system tube protein Hcp [Pseudomonas sp. MIACH]|uniref:type VI secretion system tube protein Hcp n=1 Tax=Pseudomonas sp. MIACH TaxID=1078355 RepID=UPI00069D7FAC|nr:type VI secretion system tube protein Hcp [Pseudomonas sp. MIACH]
MILLNFKDKKIKGTAKVDGHNEWITIDALHMSVGRAISNVCRADRSPSTPSFSEMSLTRATDQASPDLFMQSLRGGSLGDAEIHFIHTGTPEQNTQVFLKLILGDAIISSYSASSNGERPVETLSISFITISYTVDTFEGKSVISGTPKQWDLETNKEKI